MKGVMTVGETWKWGDTYWQVIALYRMPNGRDVARLRSISNGRNKKVWADEHPGWVKYDHGGGSLLSSVVLGEIGR